MTHFLKQELAEVRSVDPNDRGKWGHMVWEALHGYVDSIPCSGCRQFGVRFIRGMHDAINAELGKPLRYPEDLKFAKQALDKAVARCHAAGRCSESGSCKTRLERCVREVKGQKGVNPYAVCRASVRCG
jgi:hypothetical protein